MEISKACHYRSFYEAAKSMENPEERLAFYDAIDAYRFEGIYPENLPPVAKVAFILVKPNIDADISNKQGGAPIGNSNARKKQPENNPKTTENNLKTTEKQPKTTENNQLIQVVLEKTNNVDVDVEEDEEEDVDVEGDVDVKGDENYCVGECVDDCAVDNENLQTQEHRQYTHNNNFLNFNPKLNQNYGKMLYQLVYDLNKSCKRKLPINTGEYAFSCKELREFLEAAKGIHSDDQIKAIKNLYLVLNLDDVRYYPKSWKTFYSNLAEYLPENFDISRYKQKKDKQGDEEAKKVHQYELMRSVWGDMGLLNDA